jgi:hypothetical protein
MAYDNLPKREPSFGDIFPQIIQSVYADVEVEADTVLERGTVLVSTDGGLSFSVPADAATEANGVLMEVLKEDGQAAVLTMGSVNGKYVVGLTDALKISLFANKIILK